MRTAGAAVTGAGGPRRGGRRAVLACVAALAATALALRAMGRPWWCAGGEPWLWSGEVWSRHNSQHLADPYTVTHLSHGIVFFWALSVVLGARARGSLGVAIGVAIEAAWEILENTDFVIRRYREATISLDYYGDSVANALGDVCAMLVGYVVATRVSLRVSGLLFVALEVALAFWIRDGLVLNVLMLLAPLDAVRVWQGGG